MPWKRSARHIAATLLVVLPITGCQSPGPPPAWQVRPLVTGSDLHGPNGIAFGPDGQLYAGSVGAQSIYRIDPTTGDVTRLDLRRR